MAFRPSRIKARRAELGLTQGELAKLVGTTQKQVSYWEGTTKPSYAKLVKLAEALSCSTDWLLGLTDDPRSILRESDLTQDERTFLLAYRRRDTKKLQGILTEWLQEKLQGDKGLTRVK